MEVLGDAIVRDRRSDATALRAPTLGRSYDYRRFCTSAWKAGNFLRHLGVRSGAGVGVADDPKPEAVLSFYGAALLGGVVAFDPGPAVRSDVRALVVSESDLGAYDAGPETKRVAYAGTPDDPTVSQFERDVWSENPTEPPDAVSSTESLLWTQRRTYSHAELLDAAETVVETLSLVPDDEVAVAGPFTDPLVVAAGLIAPIVAGATIVVDPTSTADVVAGGPNSDVSGLSLFEDAAEPDR